MNEIPLIDPKEITLKSNVRNVTKEFNIGYYPATEGIRLLGLFAESVDVAARNKKHETSGLFGDNLQKLAIEVCKYCDVKLSNGNWQRLDSKSMIDSHVPDYELLLSLVREVHDYNSNFFNTTKLLKKSLGFVDQIKMQATKMFQGLSVSSSQKTKPRSKSSGKNTASKTR